MLSSTIIQDDRPLSNISVIGNGKGLRGYKPRKQKKQPCNSFNNQSENGEIKIWIL